MANSPDTGSMKMVIIVLILAAAGFYGVKRGWIPIPWDTRPAVSPIYDTDAKNDRYIKGSLTFEQLRLLDRVLNEEYNYGGKRLPGDRVRQLTKGDRLVGQAYGRWRKCKDLMRSSNHVVYPRERGERI